MCSAASGLAPAGGECVSSRDDWFRSADWDVAAQAAFESRLARARDHSRPQYLRIKGLALETAGLSDAARSLLQRLRADYPTSMDATSALEHLADLARDQGHLDEAIEYYETLLDGRSINGTTQAMHVSLAEVLVIQQRFEAAAEALVRRPVKDLVMNQLMYRWHACAAGVALGMGDLREASSAAARALALVSAPDQFPRHPGVGRVKTGEARIRRLDNIAGGRVSDPSDDRGLLGRLARWRR